VPYNAIKTDILNSFNSDIAATVMTFSNKTFNLVDNVLTGTLGQFNAACSDADFASTATAQTLTNKTMALASNNLTTIATGTGAVSRTVQAKLADMLDRRDFATLQQAVNAVAASGGALYLGDTDFTVTSTITLPDGDYAIIGPGSAALAITFTGTGGLFVGTGLAVTTKIAISGFTARAGAANCGPAIQIGHTSTTGVDIRAVTISDVTADINNVGSNWWSGGFYITEGSLAVLHNCYVHGPTADLTRTAYGFKFDGSAFDCKLSDCGALSVGRGVDIGGEVEGTILSNFTAVDVNVGVYKSHSASVEPWIAISGWHINARQTGFYFNNVFQTTITNGLLYAQNTAGVANWTGIEIENSSITNQDLMIDALIDCQLADAATATRGLRIRKGVGINARLKLRDMDIGAELLTDATNCVIELDCNTVDTPLAGVGAYGSTNAITVNQPGLGYLLPRVLGAFNPDNSATAEKTALLYGFGRDTTGAYKAGGGLRMASVDANWTNARAEIQVRRADAFVPGMTLFGTGTPEGAVAAPIGALYTRQDGGTGTTLYVKESGTGNTGWRAV
jgi:hypothetical protein